MSEIYEAIGRWVVAYVRRRYRRQLRALALLAVASIALGAWLASRDVEEG
jgi:hypothetical protein